MQIRSSEKIVCYERDKMRHKKSLLEGVYQLFVTNERYEIPKEYKFIDELKCEYNRKKTSKIRLLNLLIN